MALWNIVETSRRLYPNILAAVDDLGAASLSDIEEYLLHRHADVLELHKDKDFKSVIHFGLIKGVGLKDLKYNNGKYQRLQRRSASARSVRMQSNTTIRSMNTRRAEEEETEGIQGQDVNATSAVNGSTPSPPSNPKPKESFWSRWIGTAKRPKVDPPPQKKEEVREVRINNEEIIAKGSDKSAKGSYRNVQSTSRSADEVRKQPVSVILPPNHLASQSLKNNRVVKSAPPKQKSSKTAPAASKPKMQSKSKKPSKHVDSNSSSRK